MSVLLGLTETRSTHARTHTSDKWVAKVAKVGSKLAKSQNETRVRMGYCCLPPERVKMRQALGWAIVVYLERVELTVNTKKERKAESK